ncbi:MAG: insulinase family protein [Robiginitomaculum sp.]|nr:insulinase family protein [Robiginitomaculum sp.]
MKFRILALIFIAGLVLTNCSPKTSAPSQTYDFVHEISDLKPDPNVVYGKLANGLRYAVMHNKTPSGTAALRVRFATGSLNETDEQRGLAHFLEHMAFNGTKNVPEGEMIKRLERYGLQFGADTNAHTNFTETVYKLNLPEVSEDILDEAFFIMRETAENMTLDPGAIDRERGIIHSEKRARSDTANFRAMLAKLEFSTGGSRLIARLPIGTDETLNTMQSDLFESYYRQYYRPENTFVLLVGDVDTDLAIKKIKDTFADWQPVGDAGIMREIGKADIISGRVGYFSDPGILTHITISALKPFEEKPDTVANRKARLVDRLGMRILNRRLARLSEESDAEFLSARVGGMGLYKTAKGVSLTIRSHPDNWQAALAAGEQELRRALQYGFTPAELNEQIARSRLSYTASAKAAGTRRTIASFGRGLATSILNAYGNERVFTHPSTGLERFESYADSITPDQVWDAFKTRWKGIDNPLLYLATSKKIDDPKTAIRNALEASRAVKLSAPETKDIGKFAYSNFGPAGKVVSDTYVKDIDAYLVKFENNVFLNFKQTKFSKDRVAIEMAIGDGALSAPRKDEALRRLAYNMMTNGGLKAHSKDDIRTLMAGKAVGVRFMIDYDGEAFRMGITTIPSDLRDQFNLMTANVTAAGYRIDARNNYLKSIKAWYPTHDGTAQGVLEREVPRLIRSGDKRYGFGEEAEFYKPTIREVKDWIGPQLQSGMIDITIVGDIDKDAAVKAVAETFGTLPVRKSSYGSYPEMTKLVFPKGNIKPVSFTHQGDSNQAILRIYWPAPDGTDVVRTRRLNILRNIFQRRVIEVIREEEATTYSPGVGRYGVRRFEDYGYIFVTMDIEPENIPTMISKIHEIAADFQAMNISQDEFKRAIKPVVEKLDSSLENNAYWIGVLGNAQTDNWSIDNFRTREQAYKDMKLADIKPYAAEIFRKENAFHVQIVPAKRAIIDQ